jgi:internalin A
MSEPRNSSRNSMLKMSRKAQTAYKRAVEVIKKLRSQDAKDAILDLSNQNLTILPPEIGELRGLRELRLSLNQLKILPPEIGQLTSLTSLDLSHNQLKILPPEIGQLIKLVEVDLSSNKLEFLPSQITQLKALKQLEAHSNKIRLLPPEIGQIKTLEGLSLHNNQLTTLPADIVTLNALQKLNLGGNRLSCLPLLITKLTNLKHLYLWDNQLTNIPPEIAQLTQLTHLYLNHNQLSLLPAEFSQLTNLTHLYIWNNHFAELPKEIIKLRSLSELDLSLNRLSTLPPELGQLEALVELDLSGNNLSTLPPELGQLKALKSLYLTDNKIGALPSELRNLKELKELYLHGNPNLGLPEVLLGPKLHDVRYKGAVAAEPRAILDFYFARQEQGEAPMQEVRLLLVGRGRVGKTSLLKALLGEKPDAQEKETPGITVQRLDLNCMRGAVRGLVWDFGGQEFLHGTHQIFLSERCVYVLVLEGRKDDWETETDYWIRFIQSFGGDSPVVVLLNKYDEHRFSVDRFRLKERCSQIVDFVETDAFTGLGIATLLNLLQQIVNNMEDVWKGVPKKWHRVKEELTQMPESFLEYKDYQALCHRLGVEESEQQDSLAENLHRLGIALNFRNHHRLRHTSVLKPQWVTEGVYGVLRFAQKQDCHGVFKHEWLAQALSPKDYPSEKHAFVMELMEKFEVAFALEVPGLGPRKPIEAQRWLIPELLPEVQPVPFDEFRQSSVQRLRFTYPEAIPPGLLSRLIVRTHELSEGHENWRWRSGVLLEWADSRALVRLDRQQRRTEVAVIGGTSEMRQNLFDIVRAHLNVLHGKVSVVEEVQALDDPEKWVEMRELRMAEREKDDTLKVSVGRGLETERVKLPVVTTLNMVESEAARRAAGPDAERRLQLFISYAHRNEKELTPFRQHLTLLSQQGYIQVWNDRDLVAGEKWETGIMDVLKRADIVLLFYTTAARVSKFIQEKELLISLDRYDAGECTLIWVPLERSDLDPSHPLEKRLKDIQCATQDACPIYKFDFPSLGWLQVEESIRKAVQKRRKRAL